MDPIEALEQTAIAAVEYVGYANYAERQREALRAIEASARDGKVHDPEDHQNA
jgi:alkylhydroperoxidase family enzyme